MDILFILIHLIICATVFLLVKLEKLKSGCKLLPVLVLVPGLGLGLLAIEELRLRGTLKIRRKIGVESFKISDIRYKRIDVDDNSDQDITVPLEEAISVNDASVRRRLMMDILQKNPEEYIGLLQMTRTADDTELTHYATTTMMEIQTHYENRIHELSEENRRNPGDIGTLKMYRKALLKYIESGLISGKIIEIYRQQLDGILGEICRQLPDNRLYYQDWIKNRIALGDTAGLDGSIEKMMKRWPKEESSYQIYIEYLWKNNRGDEIPEVLKLIADRDVYLSRKGKEWLEFWEKKDL